MKPNLKSNHYNSVVTSFTIMLASITTITNELIFTNVNTIIDEEFIAVEE